MLPVNESKSQAEDIQQRAHGGCIEKHIDFDGAMHQTRNKPERIQTHITSHCTDLFNLDSLLFFNDLLFFVFVIFVNSGSIVGL